MNICFLAGETSGDLHGAGVVAALREIAPEVRCWGMCGSAMQAVGCEPVVDTREMSVMGFYEVLSHLPTIYRNEERLRRAVLERQPDVILAIDYPGFNLRFAHWVHKAFTGNPRRPKLLGYISPQVWAWKAGRIPTIAQRYDGLAVVFPFELDSYRDVKFDVRFVGHPLLEELPSQRTFVEARKTLGLLPNDIVVAMLPGSRKQEIERHTQLLSTTLKLLKQRYPGIIALVPALSQQPRSLYAPLEAVGARLIFDDATIAVMAADCAAVTSGTATLQTALLGTPMVVLYKTSPITYAIGKRVVHVPYIALANLVMNELVAPERIQHDATPARLTQDIIDLLGESGKKQVAKFSTLRDRLGGPGASRRVAEWIVELSRK